MLAQTVVPPWVGSWTGRRRLTAGIRSTKVTSVCQLLALPCVESIGSTALALPANRGVRRSRGAEQAGELVLGRVVEVVLTGEEDDLVLEQGAADLGDGSGARSPPSRTPLIRAPMVSVTFSTVILA